jgi:hypothetical protein
MLTSTVYHAPPGNFGFWSQCNPYVLSPWGVQEAKYGCYLIITMSMTFKINARLIDLLLLNHLMNNLMFATFWRTSLLSFCSLAFFTSTTLGAHSRKILLHGYVFSGSCKQDLARLLSIGIWVFQHEAEVLLLCEQNEPQLLAQFWFASEAVTCHLQRLVKVLIHERTTQAIWGRQIS